MFRHKLLVLFKLALLERRVLLQHSPVSELCSAVLALTSLFPGMVQTGLSRAVLQPRPPSRRTSAVRTPSREEQPSHAAGSASADATASSTAATTAATASSTAATAETAPDGGLRRASDCASDLVTGNSTFYRSHSGSGSSTSTSCQPSLQRSQSDGAGGRDSRLGRTSVFYDTTGTEEGVDVAARTSTFYTDSGAGAGQEQQEEQEQQSVDARVERLLAATQRLDDVQCGMPLRRFRKVGKRRDCRRVIGWCWRCY